MRVNGALQGRRDECPDMTVIHGDVYCKLREGEGPNLRGIQRKKGRGGVKEGLSLQHVLTKVC